MAVAKAKPTGWVVLAGILMIMVGFFQSIAGLTAIFDPGIYVATTDKLWLLNYTAWGWVHLVIGLVLILSAGSLFAGKLWGKFLAITLAVISAVANFSYIWSYPLWSIVIIAMDIYIIYGVAMYTGESEDGTLESIK